MTIKVDVHGGNGEKAIRDLKRRMQRELIFRKMKEKRCHEPLSVKKVREKQESDRRVRKNNRKKRLES